MPVCYDSGMNTPKNSEVVQVAAKAAIMDRDGKVLILREAKTGEDNTNIGQWGLPGGRYEGSKDASFWDTLHREVSEETGLKVEPVRIVYIGEWEPMIRGVKHHIFAIFVLCRVVGGELAVSHEHDRAELIDPADRAQYDIVRPDDYVVDCLAGTTPEELYALPAIAEDK